jgi:putative holliday junction resolvase
VSAVQPTSPLVPAAGRVIGVDLGTRRIGIAVTDSDQRLATGVTFIGRNGDPVAERAAIGAVVVEYEAVGVVVGLPRSLSGALGPAARAALAEVDKLRALLDVPVDTVDERFTTVTAAAGLRAAGRPARRQRTLVDQTAAAVALQAWLDGRGIARPGAQGAGTGTRAGG